jgi:hypothetical protein
MNMATETPRKKKAGEGRDPILAARAPAPLIALVHAKAAERKVGVSALIREALGRHVGTEEAA